MVGNPVAGTFLLLGCLVSWTTANVPYFEREPLDEVVAVENGQYVEQASVDFACKVSATMGLRDIRWQHPWSENVSLNTRNLENGTAVLRLTVPSGEVVRPRVNVYSACIADYGQHGTIRSHAAQLLPIDLDSKFKL